MWHAPVLLLLRAILEARTWGRVCRFAASVHVVERFTPDTKAFALTREYVVEDPVYLAAADTGSDVVLLSDTPFEKQPCAELTFEFTQPGKLIRFCSAHWGTHESHGSFSRNLVL